MHWATYWRLYAEHNDAQKQALDGMGAKLGLLHRVLQRGSV